MSDLFGADPDSGLKPVAGRRAMLAAASPEAQVDDTDSTTVLNANSETETSPRPAPKQGGWGENTTVSVEDPRFSTQSSSDLIETIPIIPVLEEIVEEDMSFQVAEAPNIQVNRVATIRELDQELNKHSALMMLDNKIDLKCLTRFLNAESSVKEDDKPWYWDRLFTEVASEMNSEWESLRELETGTVPG